MLYRAGKRLAGRGRARRAWRASRRRVRSTPSCRSSPKRGAGGGARQSEARWRRGAPVGAVDGVPATIKDNIWAQGLPTRRGSRTGDPTPASDDAPAVARLREAGRGHPRQDHACRNMAGSASATARSPASRAIRGIPSTRPAARPAAARWRRCSISALLHLGTDGAGSLRIPAAFTGVFGMKPSFGQVPAYPASPFNVLAHQGPITRTVARRRRDAVGDPRPDARDMTAWNTPAPDFTAGLEKGVRGLRIAWSPRLGHVGELDAEIEAATRKAARCSTGRAHRRGGRSALSRAPRHHPRAVVRRCHQHRRCGAPERERGEMDPGFLRGRRMGAALSRRRISRAYAARADSAQAMLEFHERYDLLLTPTMPITALQGRAAWRRTTRTSATTGSTGRLTPIRSTSPSSRRPRCPAAWRATACRSACRSSGRARDDALVLRAARALEQALPMPPPRPATEFRR